MFRRYVYRVFAPMPAARCLCVNVCVCVCIARSICSCHIVFAATAQCLCLRPYASVVQLSLDCIVGVWGIDATASHSQEFYSYWQKERKQDRKKLPCSAHASPRTAALQLWCASLPLVSSVSSYACHCSRYGIAHSVEIEMQSSLADMLD